MAHDRLTRLAAMTAVLGLPACTVTMVDSSYAPAPAYAPLDIADNYAWIDRADTLWKAIGDAPPDYAFVFEGAEPWAWETADGHQIVVEDAGTGGIRSYYFAPGESIPFLAVEPGASFGFAGNGVAMVYGPDGGALPREQWAARLDRAMQLFARARLLKRAMIARDRRGVDADAWNDASGLILNFVMQWDSGQRRYPGWRAHRDSAEATDRRHRLERERDRRRGEAGRFDHWRQGGFQGPPPAGFEPPHRDGPRAGRPPQPRPQPGAGRPDRPDIGTTPPRPQPEAGFPRQPRPQPVRPPSKVPVETPFVDDAVAPPPPPRPERPRPAPDRPRAAAPIYSPPPAPASAPPPPPVYVAPPAPPPPPRDYSPPPPARPTPQPAERPRTQKVEPQEDPS